MRSRKTEPVQDAQVHAVEHVEQHLRKRNKLRRARRFRRRIPVLIKGFCVFALIALFVVYDAQPSSRIRIITVNPLSTYQREDILQKAGISIGSRMWLAPAALIGYRTEQLTGIRKADVSVDLASGVVSLRLEEWTVSFQIRNESGQQVIYYANGQSRIVDNVSTEFISYENSDDEATRVQVAIYLGRLDRAMITAISEVRRTAASYDSEELKLTLDNGIMITTSVDGLALLDHFTDVLTNAQTDPENKCYTIIEEEQQIRGARCE